MSVPNFDGRDMLEFVYCNFARGVEELYAGFLYRYPGYAVLLESLIGQEVSGRYFYGTQYCNVEGRIEGFTYTLLSELTLDISIHFDQFYVDDPQEFINPVDFEKLVLDSEFGQLNVNLNDGGEEFILTSSRLVVYDGLPIFDLTIGSIGKHQ